MAMHINLFCTLWCRSLSSLVLPYLCRCVRGGRSFLSLSVCCAQWQGLSAIHHPPPPGTIQHQHAKRADIWRAYRPTAPTTHPARSSPAPPPPPSARPQAVGGTEVRKQFTTRNPSRRWTSSLEGATHTQTTLTPHIRTRDPPAHPLARSSPAPLPAPPLSPKSAFPFVLGPSGFHPGKRIHGFQLAARILSSQANFRYLCARARCRSPRPCRCSC